jgi:hypothetical protein
MKQLATRAVDGFAFLLLYEHRKWRPLSADMANKQAARHFVPARESSHSQLRRGRAWRIESGFADFGQHQLQLFWALGFTWPEWFVQTLSASNNSIADSRGRLSRMALGQGNETSDAVHTGPPEGATMTANPSANENRLPLLHFHVCVHCNSTFRREAFEGRALTSGIFTCPKCGLDGPLNVEIRELREASAED